MISGQYIKCTAPQMVRMARPTIESPKTQIYFTTHRSGAFPVPRVRTVVRGERASRSIVNRTTALWSIWVVASLILAGLGFVLFFVETCGREFVESRGVFGAPNLDKSCSAGKDGIYH